MRINTSLIPASLEQSGSYRNWLTALDYFGILLIYFNLVEFTGPLDNRVLPDVRSGRQPLIERHLHYCPV